MFKRLQKTIFTGVALTGAVVTMAEGQTLDDPTRPYQAAAPTGTAREASRPFELSGVLVSSSRRVAVINGKLYREGDEIDGARIVRIEPRSVRLQRGNRFLDVPMSGEPPKSLITRGDPTS